MGTSRDNYLKLELKTLKWCLKSVQQNMVHWDLSSVLFANFEYKIFCNFFELGRSKQIKVRAKLAAKIQI